jgi:type I restriction enzyme R subunit
MEDELRSVLGTINPGLPKAAIDEVIFKIRNYEVGSLVSKNETFMDYLQNGMQVSYRDKNEQKATIVNLVDYDNPSANSLILNVGVCLFPDLLL